MCQFCDLTFKSLLIDKNDAMSESMLALGNHVQTEHPSQYKDVVQRYLVLSQCIHAYMVPSLTGKVGPALAIDGENPIETRLKELHRLILDGIKPPAIDTEISKLII